MDPQIQSRFDTEIIAIKHKIQQEIIRLGFSVEKTKANELYQFINDLEKPVLLPGEFAPSKKPIPIVKEEERCVAVIMNGKQCQRKKTKNSCYCGTHGKQLSTTTASSSGVSCAGATTDETMPQTVCMDKVEVEIREIRGIPYYVDKKNNVYKHEEIHQPNPVIIGKLQVETGEIVFVA